MDHVVLLLVCIAPVVWCYGSGQVGVSCGDMRPQHSGLNPQTRPVVFTVTTDRSSYRLGEDVKVQLQAPASTPFTGFLLQAREVGGQSAVGSFTLTAGAAQLLTCNQKPNSAVSHKSPSSKTSIQVTWRSEATTVAKSIQFHASFVQNFKTFWVDVRSPVLTTTKDSTGGLVTGGTATTPAMTTAIYQTAPPANNISSAGCGVTKLCFSKPSNCDPKVSADCYFMSAMALSPGHAAVRYEMTGPSVGYISFGFSDDQKMGNDDIYICGIGSNGLVQVQHAFSTGTTTPQTLPLGNVSDVSGSVQNMVISCSFNSMNILSTQRSTGFNQTYYLLFAYGPSSNGQILVHTDTFVSADKMDISRPQMVRYDGWSAIIKAHGALMLIAWMTTGSLGMMVARYLKKVAKGQSLWGKDIWFVIHVAVMCVTVTVTIIAFILAFAYVQSWAGGSHPVLGCLVMILSFFQPILALLRCGPQHPRRFLFNWSHALNALTIKILSVAAIFTGLKLIDSTLDQWLIKVMGGFVGWEVLFYILLEVHVRWMVNSKDNLESKTVSTDLLLMALFFLGNLTFLVALLVGIAMA